MHSLCNRWSIVAMAIAAVLLVADVRSGAGGKQGTSKKAPAAGKPLLRVDGELTDKDSRDKSAKDCYCKTFPIELSAGATYRIDLVSKDFDPFLRLEDPTGAKVAEDNDSGGRVNARIAYKAAKSGMHKIVVSTFGANETGKFKLTATLESPAQDKAVEKVEKKEPAKQPAKEPPSKAPPGKAIALKLEAGKPLQVNGQLAKSDATDADKKHFKLYTITLTGGMEYRIDMKGGKDLDAYLRVEDEAGKIMAEDQFGDPNESGVKFTPAKTARFRIVCTSYKAGMTGNYTLKVAEQSAPKKPATPPPGKEPPKKEPPKKEPPKKEPPKKEPPAKKTPPKEQTLQVEVGKPITIKGQITDKDKKNATGRFFKAYTFQALAGHLYRFEMTGQGDFDPQVSIQNMAGQTVRSEDHGDLGFSRLSFQPAQSGNYRLIAGAFLTGKTGSFTLTGSVLAPPEPHRKPTVAAMPAFKPVLRTEISGQLTEKDGTDKDGRAYKVFTFQANPKKMYIIAMTGIGFGAQLRLEDANGKLIKYEDDFAGNASHLHVPAGSGGTLRIIAAAPAPNQFGTFTITITERDPVPAALNTVVFERSALINGRLTGDDGIDTLGKFQKVYVINATAGKYYSCELTAKGFDAVLRLEDAKGTFLRGESAGARNNSRLEFRADAAQTYHLVIAAVLRGQFGDFVLKIAERDKPSIAGAPPQAPLQPAKQTAAPAPSSTPFKLADGKSTIDGTITAKDPRDNHGRFFKAFPFTAAKGRTYRFEIVGKGGLDPLVRIDDDAGRPIKDEDFGDGKVSRVTFHAYTAGTYRVIASTFNPNQTGAFTLSASELDIKPATPVPLTLKDGKASIQGKLTAADAVLLTGNKVYQEYTFTAQAGTTYKIDLASKAFNAYLALKDAQGKTLAANDDANPSTLDARIVHTAPKTATYHILVTSLAGGFGPFVLAVGEAAGADKLASLVEALMTAPADERRQILTEVEQDFQAIAGKLTQADAELAQRAAQNLEVTDRQLAAEAYAALGKILAGSSSANIAKDGKVMLGAARRLGLIGNRLEVTGTTTDGKTFDLAKLKGKVVLVNFWASWCLECKAELPNIRKLYDKYHAQGFEVIGISADNKESELTSYLKKEELPWPSIYKEANAIADAYGVFRIPLSILVGRDGRVLSLNARGAELERLLAEQFQGKK